MILPEVIESKIYLIRGQKIMIDFDLSALYGVTTKSLNQAVKRNLKRFPNDFMFRLSREETDSLRSQNVTSNDSRGGRRYLPYAFTEQGVAMLSSVLNSDRAIQVNIEIMRTFTKLRLMLSEHKDILRKIENMEAKYDKKFRIIFETLRKMLNPPEPPRKQIGFRK